MRTFFLFIMFIIVITVKTVVYMRTMNNLCTLYSICTYWGYQFSAVLLIENGLQKLQEIEFNTGICVLVIKLIVQLQHAICTYRLSNCKLSLIFV